MDILNITENNFNIITTHSMNKIILDQIAVESVKFGSMLLNERFSFICAIRNESDFVAKNCSIKISGELENFLTCKKIVHVPAEVVNYPYNCDDYVLTNNSGLFPDILLDIEGQELILPPNKWVSVFITIDGRVNALQAGKYKINIDLLDENNLVKNSTDFNLEIYDCKLAENDLYVTNWIHYDCIADKHQKKVFSEEYFDILKKYISTAVFYGHNMLLTPIFTFPLDTKVNGERSTFQLVEIEKKDMTYIFDFKKLDFFIDFAFSLGIKYIEFSHLFTQWGAKAAPKIKVKIDGIDTKCFGWECASDSEEYHKFLDQFLSALYNFIVQKHIEDKCFIHISDEPFIESIDRYLELKNFIKKKIGNVKIIDALSKYEFYERGAVDIPVVATDHADKFIENSVDYWCYYCSGQSNDYLSNRFFCMPGQRTRILGFQLYLNNAKGFLHWGFNFYNSQNSMRSIDPYITTDCDGSFPAGDAFVVYPFSDKVLSSIRLELMFEAFQDYCALKTLESFKDRKYVLELLQLEELKGFKQYNRDAFWHLDFRNRINREIEISSRK